MQAWSAESSTGSSGMGGAWPFPASERARMFDARERLAASEWAPWVGGEHSCQKGGPCVCKGNCAGKGPGGCQGCKQAGIATMPSQPDKPQQLQPIKAAGRFSVSQAPTLPVASWAAAKAVGGQAFGEWAQDVRNWMPPPPPRSPTLPGCRVPVPPGEKCPEEFVVPAPIRLPKGRFVGEPSPCASCPTVGTPASPCPVGCLANGCCNFVGQIPGLDGPDLPNATPFVRQRVSHVAVHAKPA